MHREKGFLKRGEVPVIRKKKKGTIPSSWGENCRTEGGVPRFAEISEKEGAVCL